MFFRKNKINQINNELSEDKKITVNVKKLKEFLGGPSNIGGIEFTNTKIKILIIDRSKTAPDKINSLKNISGVFAGKGYISIIVGKQAKQLSKKLI